MFSISKTDQLSARVSVKIPRPDSLVEVRVTPPDSAFQVKVSPGEEVIELLIQPGSSMVEVRISPPSQEDSEKLAGQFSRPSGVDFQPGEGDATLSGDEPLPGVSRAEFAALVEEAESAEAKKLLEQMAEASPGQPEAPEAAPEAPEADELDQPPLAGPQPDNLAETELAAEPDDFDQPDDFDDRPEALTLENEDLEIVAKPTPAGALAPAEPAASRTLEWVPVSPSGAPIEEDDQPLDPGVVGAAALDALARLNLAVQEEEAALEEEFSRPAAQPSGAAANLSSADSTIMVEMYDDYEPGPNPADTVTPPAEDELMDISEVEKDEDLAVGPIDVDGLGELDLEKSHFAESKNEEAAIRARPMVQVIPGNTVVPE